SRPSGPDRGAARAAEAEAARVAAVLSAGAPLRLGTALSRLGVGVRPAGEPSPRAAVGVSGSASTAADQEPVGEPERSSSNVRGSAAAGSGAGTRAEATGGPTIETPVWSRRGVRSTCAADVDIQDLPGCNGQGRGRVAAEPAH